MKTYLKNLIKELKFVPEEGTKGIFIKTYTNHNNYNIRINFNDEQIEYGDKITIGDKTTSNFSSRENFVVLECVNRLLEKGYSPEKITLEIKWDLGKKEKGKLDIYVADKDDDTKCFLMIECKTFEEEYEKEKKNMLSNGGQLFSYFQQDKSAKYLCLYASTLINNEINYINSIVEINEDIKNANNKNESYSIWNKSFKDNGIFEECNDAYDFKSKSLIREKLKPLQQSDSGFIFNRFAEILRHNVVSDKPNAFNKIFNLFLCKIEDENKNPEEELMFQWKENDTYMSLQNRLNDLYKKGMESFLNIKVVDFNNNDLNEDLSSLSESSKKHIEEMFMKLRLYKNNEFAFKEVFDDVSFIENSKVVKEVVELLQPFQLKYSHKQQFLGDFFELLLNTGLKQESGQFFTPVPVAKFITSSMPFKNIIDENLSKKIPKFLPYVIDYAAGSGHFLTEAMDEIQQIINKMETTKFYPTAKQELNTYMNNPYGWAEEFIYGIEKDYRLVKTAKVACFLNGDGLANLFHADGLDSFEKSKDYLKNLKITKDNKQNNHQFDVIVANPPYSVSSFKNTLKNGKESFDLFDRLTDNSSEIECLFIERTKQLLKEGAYAGIVLPSSILSNGGIYTDTRDIILKNFKIIAIAELGSNTFMATGTNTVVLFLKKKKETEFIKIEEKINQFIKNPNEDITCNGIENAFSTYYNYVYKDMENFEHYKNILIGGFDNKINTIKSDITSIFLKEYEDLFKKTNEYKTLLKKKIFNEVLSEEEKSEEEKSEEEKSEEEEKFEKWRTIYIDNLLTFIKEREKEKLLHFMMSYNNQVVLVKSGEKDIEKEFLGYEFSNRRGHEGMRMYTDKNGELTTKLYDTKNPENKEKANYYIQKAFIGETFEEKDIDSNLSEHIFLKNLHEIIGFDKMSFDKNISLEIKKKSKLETKWDLFPLGEICDVKIGGTPSRNEKQYYKDGNNLWVSISEMNGNVIEDTKEKITNLGVEKSNVKLIKAGTTLLSFKLSIGKTAIAGKDLYTNEAIAALEIKDKEKILDKYLFVLFSSKVLDLNADFKAFGKSLNSTMLKGIKIPIPPIEEQIKIVEAFEEKVNEKIKMEEAIENEKININAIIEKINLNKISISELCETTSGGTPLTTNQNYYVGGNIPWLKSTEIRTGKIFKAETFITEEGLQNSSAKYIPENSVLIAMYGATAGQVGLLKFETTTNQAICALLPNEKYNSEYVFFYLKNKTEELLSLTIGTAQKNLSQTIIGNYKIPLPSRKEQNKIVSEINIIEEKIKELEEDKSKIEIELSQIIVNNL